MPIKPMTKERVLLHLSCFKKKLSRNDKLICAVKLIQFFLIFLLLFKQNLFNYLQNAVSPEFMQSINQIMRSIFENDQLLILMGCTMAVLMIVAVSHCFFLQVQFRTEKHELLSERLLLVLVLFEFVLGLIQVSCLYNLGKLFSQTQDPKWLVIVCLNGISFWPFIIIEFRLCPIVFDLSALFVIPIMPLISSNYKFLFIAVMSLFYSWIKTHKLERTLYVLVGLVSVWNYIDMELMQYNAYSLPQDKLILIALSIILLAYLMVKAEQYCHNNQNQNEIQLILHLIQSTKTQNLLESNHFQYVFSAWQIIMKFIQNSNDFLNTAIKFKQVQNLTKTDLIRSLRQHVRESITSQKDISNRILYLKLKILDKTKFIQIIEGVQSLMLMKTRDTLSIREQFLLVEFQQYVEQKLFDSDNDKKVDTAFIIEKALVTQQFYNKAAQCFREIIKFWQFFGHQSKSKQQISCFFQRILSSENLLRCKFERLSQYKEIVKERKLMIEIQHVLNGHSIISDFNLKSNETFHESQRLNDQVDNRFLVMDQRKIIKCSFEFLNQMGYTEDQLINADKKIIFGERFVEYLDNELRQVTFQDKRVLMLPIYNKQRIIVIKQCSILVYPEIKSQVKYLISFTDIQHVTNSSILIYTPLTDCIQFVNPKFINQFQFDQIKVLHKISHNNLFSNELFAKIDLSSAQVKQLLRQQKPINCQIVLKNLSTIKLQKLPINISIINQFSTNSQTFYILTIKKGTFIKTEITLTEHETTKHHMDSDDENLNQAEKYRNEKFFCPINNSYSIKITQKLSQIADKGRKNYLFYLTILFMFAVILLTGQIVYSSYMMTEQRINDLKSDEEFIFNKNNDYIRISYLYSLFFKTEYFRNYPSVLTFLNNQLILDQVLQFYLGEIQKTLKDFLSDHLNILRLPSQGDSIEYQLQFDQFQVETDTSKSTFIDFSQSFSQYVKTYERSFLFSNYLSFRDVSEKFSDMDLSTDKIAQTFSSSILTAYITLIVSIPLAIIGITLSIKIQISISQMYKLLDLLEEKDSEEVLEKINQLKGKLKQIDSIFQKKQLQNQASKFSTARIIELTDKIKEQQSNKQIIDNIKSKNYKSKELQISQENQPLSSGNEESPKDKIQKTVKKEEIQSDSVLVIVLRNIFNLIFLGFVGIIIYLQISYRNNQLDIFVSLLKYEKQLFQSESSLIEIENDFYFKAENSKFYKPANFTFYETHSYESLHSFSSLDDMEQLEGFNGQQQMLLFNDLCLQQFDYFITIEGLDCQSVAGGTLANGFSQAFSIYTKMAIQMKNLTLDNFLTQPCMNDKCPIFIQEFYLNAKLYSLIADHMAKFRQFYQTVAQNQSSQNRYILIIQFCLMIGLTVAFAIWIYFLGKRCKRSIKMFQIIPPYIMKKMKMTTFIRKNNILSSLSVL